MPNLNVKIIDTGGNILKEYSEVTNSNVELYTNLQKIKLQSNQLLTELIQETQDGDSSVVNDDDDDENDTVCEKRKKSLVKKNKRLKN